MAQFEFAHVGINCENEKEAIKTAERFSMLFGLEAKNGTSSVFAGKIVEAMKAPYLGRHGHIAIGTPDVKQAMEELSAKGIKFREDSAKYKENRMTAIYLEDEIAGFAVHLVEKK